MRRSLLLLPILVVSLFIAGLSQSSEIAGLLDAGTLVSKRDGAITLVESYSFTQLTDGTYKLVSTFTDLFSQVKSHDLTLDSDFLPVYYTARQSSPTEDDKTVTVEFEDKRAIVTITTADEQQRTTFNTDTEFGIFDDSTVSKMGVFLRRLLHLGGTSYRFDVLFASTLNFYPSELRFVGENTLRSGSQTIPVHELIWDIADGALVVRIFANEGNLVAVAQPTENGQEIIYRSDLYPAGIEF